MQPPETGPRAVFIDRFHVPVALTGPGSSAYNFGQEGFRGRVAMQDIVLAALFVIQNELNSDPGTIWPFRIRRVSAIALHVARISGRVNGHFDSLVVSAELHQISGTGAR